MYSGIACAQTPPPETGVWLDDSGNGAVEIYVCADRADRLCGRIVWLREPLNAQGLPKRDRFNPKQELQTRPICGLPVLGNLARVQEGGLDGGWIYDPKAGKSYSAAIELGRQDKLTVTGYVGMKFLSKSFTWTRAPGELVRCEGAPGSQAKVKPAAPAAQPKPPVSAALAPAKAPTTAAPAKAPPAAAANVAVIKPPAPKPATAPSAKPAAATATATTTGSTAKVTATSTSAKPAANAKPVTGSATPPAKPAATAAAAKKPLTTTTTASGPASEQASAETLAQATAKKKKPAAASLESDYASSPIHGPFGWGD